MKPISCTEVDRSLWLYIDRELSAGGLQAISAHLRECDACRGMYHERALEASQYRMAFLDSPFGDDFVAKLTKRMESERLLESSSRPGGEHPGVSRGGWRGLHGDRPRGDGEGGVRSPLSATHRGRFRRLVTVAAMLLLIPAIVIVGIVFDGPMPESLGTLYAESGEVTLGRVGEAGRSLPDVVEVTSPSALFAGSVCRVDRGAVARLQLASQSPGGRGALSTLVLDGPAIFAVDAKASRSSFHGTLEEGALKAKVAPRGLSEPFVIRTPHATATVVGTLFELLVTRDETRLSVVEGKVKLRSIEGLPDQGVEVTRSSGSFAARRGATQPVPLGDASGQKPPDAPGAATEPELRSDQDAGAAPPSTPAHREPSADEPGAPSRPDPDLDMPRGAGGKE